MVEIPLTNSDKVVLIDDTDAKRVQQYPWSLLNAHSRYPQIVTHIDGKIISMHRFVLGVADAQKVRHRNCDNFDNRRTNLIAVSNDTYVQAGRKLSKNNTTGYKGVIWEAKRGRWRAEIRINGKTRNLGRYGSAEEAARVYDTKARELFGLFARTNADLGLL